MSEIIRNPAPVRTFTTSAPIKACRLRREDLARLYRIINERQIAYAQTVVAQLAQQPTESPEQFEQRRSRVANAFVTTVVVTGANKETVSGSGEQFLGSDNIPDKLLTVFYTTLAGPNAIGIALQNWATLLLDFSRPTVLDFSKLPTLPTTNASKFDISSTSEAWFTLLNKHLLELFRERSTGFDWLHQEGMYDLLLFIVGLPFALRIAYWFRPIIHNFDPPHVLEIGSYIYLFIGGLFIFRGLFTYSRWVFPKIEMLSHASAPRRQRRVWAAIMIGVIGSAIWDAIKALAG